MTEHKDAIKNGTLNSPSPAKVKLLLVDDEERFRKNLSSRLTLRGYQVHDVDNGEDAIRKVRLNQPDVVLLDRKMPNMGGEEVLREIKKIAPEVQIIMLTGHANINSAAAAGRLDTFAYLEKPCETSDLIKTIEAASKEKMSVMGRYEIPQNVALIVKKESGKLGRMTKYITLAVLIVVIILWCMSSDYWGINISRLLALDRILN